MIKVCSHGQSHTIFLTYNAHLPTYNIPTYLLPTPKISITYLSFIIGCDQIEWQKYDFHPSIHPNVHVSHNRYLTYNYKLTCMFDNTYKSYKKQFVCYLLLDVIDDGWNELTFHPKCTTITPNNHICNYKLAHAKIHISK